MHKLVDCCRLLRKSRKKKKKKSSCWAFISLALCDWLSLVCHILLPFVLQSALPAMDNRENAEQAWQLGPKWAITRLILAAENIEVDLCNDIEVVSTKNMAPVRFSWRLNAEIRSKPSTWRYHLSGIRKGENCENWSDLSVASLVQSCWGFSFSPLRVGALPAAPNC